MVSPANTAALSESSTVPGSLNLKHMQEAQFSMCVVGIDNTNWTAYTFADEYYDDNDVEQLKARQWTPDRVASRCLRLGQSAYNDPREYFLGVFEIQVKLILQEWRSLAAYIEEEVKWCVKCP